MTDQATMRTRPNGTQEWRLPSGHLHRDDGPAITYADGDEAWYQHHQLHRVDGPAITYPDGTDFWYQNSQCHRDDGPAVAYSDGDEYWYQRGKLHRVGGPAVVYSDGTREWWVADVRLQGFELEVARRAWEKAGCPR